MPWGKLIKSLNTPYVRLFLLLVFVLFYFVTRVPRIDSDTINPDGVNWHFRSQQFVNGLKERNWDKTYQHYHPGVTLMWVTGLPVELTKKIYGYTSYDIFNFQTFDFVAKFSLVCTQLVLSLLILFYLSRVVGYYPAFISLILLTFEPFFIGNSRIYHLDILLALFSFLSLILFYLALKKSNTLYVVLAGVTASLSFLTKSVAIGIPVFFLFVWIYTLFVKKEPKLLLKQLAVFFIVFLITTFTLFPALWTSPVATLSEIFSEGLRVGVRKGHEQVLLGETTMDGGVLFYPLVLLIKLSPFIFITSILGIIRVFFVKRSHVHKDFALYLFIFYAGYFFAMVFPTKKIDRYMLEMFPMFAFFSYLGVAYLSEYIKGLKIFLTLLISYFLFVFYPLIHFFPYYFIYASPLVGGVVSANKLIAQKPFGIGVYDLKDFLLQKYPTMPKLGFIDTKPIKTIYPNSKVFDIRVNGANDYDLIILGVNEVMPSKVLDSKYKFEKRHDLYINGLQYWSIYEKLK